MIDSFHHKIEEFGGGFQSLKSLISDIFLFCRVWDFAIFRISGKVPSTVTSVLFNHWSIISYLGKEFRILLFLLLEEFDQTWFLFLEFIESIKLTELALSLFLGQYKFSNQDSIPKIFTILNKIAISRLSSYISIK